MKEAFLKRMKLLLQDEYDAYVKSLSSDAYKGLRVNTAKISIEDFLKLNIVDCKPSSICPQSFYIPSDTKSLGNHFAHLAGLFYMQEPSAASAVELMDVKANDWVLDLCSAPGGKSSQIAAKLNQEGFLVSNEIEAKRAMVLMGNMERLGFGNNMITSAHPQKLCEQLKGCFDKVLVDAPCSGEGMFKIHEEAINAWSKEHVEACAKRQLMILDSAYQALKQNGIMVYSTCTYSPEENEAVIAKFIQLHPDMELVDSNVCFGRQGFDGYGIDAAKVVRIFPMDQGEGHFACKMIKKGEQKASRLHYLPITSSKDVKAFVNDQIDMMPQYFYELNNKLFVSQIPLIDLKAIRVLRRGIMVGERIKQRIEPHQHFYTSALFQNHYRKTINLNDEQAASFIAGNVLNIPCTKGYVAMSWHGYNLGFGKSDGIQIKNKYPKGLRIKR